MTTSTMKCILFGYAAMAMLLASSAVASDVNPGHDLFVTPRGGGVHDFADMPIPADFFGPGSDPISSGSVDLAGNPLGTFMGFNVHDTDTIVRRRDTARLPDGVGESDTISTEIVALSLKSITPITVTFNGGQDPESWNLEITLSPAAQPIGSMTITHSSSSGGAFSSSLSVIPLLTFTNVGDPGQVQELDGDDVGFQADMSTTNMPTWQHVPTSGQLVVPGLTGDESNLGAPGDADFYVLGEVRHDGAHPKVIPTPTPKIPMLPQWGLIGLVVLTAIGGAIIIGRWRAGVRLESQ